MSPVKSLTRKAVPQERAPGEAREERTEQVNAMRYDAYHYLKFSLYVNLFKRNSILQRNNGGWRNAVSPVDSQNRRATVCMKRECFVMSSSLKRCLMEAGPIDTAKAACFC